MASRFRDRVLQSSGTTSKEVKSDIATKMMKLMGWQPGQGLGKEKQGSTEVIQIKRREENLGLGKRDEKGKFQWNDKFWENSYNNGIQKLQNYKAKEESTTDKSEMDETSSEEEFQIIKKIAKKVKLVQYKAPKQEKKIKKAKQLTKQKQTGSSEDSMEYF